MSTNHGNAHSLRRWLAAAALALVSLSAHAQFVGGAVNAPSAAVERFMFTITGANQQTVGFGSNGTPVVTTTPANLAPDGGAGIKITQTGNVPNRAGNPISVSQLARIPNSQLALALGRLNTAGLLLTVGSASYALTQELLYQENPDKTVSKLTNFYDCTEAQTLAGTCYFWNVDTGNTPTFRRHTNDALCTMLAPIKGWGNTTTYREESVAPNTYVNQPNYECRWYRRSDNLLVGITSNSSGGSGFARRAVPSSWQAFLDEIASKSGWPTTSAIAKAAVEAAVKTGTKLQPDPLGTPTGPASTAGRTNTKTSTNPDGSTRTETQTCQYNHTYGAGATQTINTTEVCTTTVTNDGALGQNKTSTETKQPETAETDPCKNSPGRAGCAELGEAPQQDVPKSSVTLTYATENLGFGGGTCPTSPTWNDTLGSHTLNMGPICSILSSVVKPLVILFSLLAAVFIILPRES